MTAASREALQQALMSLPEPHKTVFERIFFDEEDWQMIASVFDRTDEEIFQIFEEAVDMVSGDLGIN